MKKSDILNNSIFFALVIIFIIVTVKFFKELKKGENLDNEISKLHNENKDLHNEVKTALAERIRLNKELEKAITSCKIALSPILN